MGIRRRAILTASMAFACVFLTLALPAPGQEKAPAPEPATTEVEGEGEVFSRPDQAVLFFHIDTQAAGAKEAVADNAKASEAFLKAMKPLLGPEESLKTLAYQVVPLYQQVEKGQGPRKVQTQEVRGYRVSHVFEVRVKDLGQLGKILDTGLEHGATRVRGPFY